MLALQVDREGKSIQTGSGRVTKSTQRDGTTWVSSRKEIFPHISRKYLSLIHFLDDDFWKIPSIGGGVKLAIALPAIDTCMETRAGNSPLSDRSEPESQIAIERSSDRFGCVHRAVL